ncbi:MAG: hypothetical protein H7Y28_15840 [Rhodoferax sp.]|nr:hypothetical protein [Rhodoferax sp.]
MKRFLRNTVRNTALCTLLACSALPALAIGRLADINLIDRATGNTLPVYVHRGEYWVAGQPDARYAISIRNKGGERLLAVTSVDGINVLSGASAGYNQTGYVFGSYTGYEITGWRKSDSEIAAFEFAAAGDSYAAQTGRPAQVGVIGVALFKERLPEPAPPPVIGMLGRKDGAARESRAREEAGPAPAAPAAKSLASNLGESSRAADGATATVQRLGTGHGQRETSVVSHTGFERAQHQPNEVIRIRYESRESLIAMGVIPDTNRRIPKPFPQSDTASYVPDPPRRF